MLQRKTVRGTAGANSGPLEMHRKTCGSPRLAFARRLHGRDDDAASCDAGAEQLSRDQKTALRLHMYTIQGTGLCFMAECTLFRRRCRRRHRAWETACARNNCTGRSIRTPNAFFSMWLDAAGLVGTDGLFPCQATLAVIKRDYDL